MADQGTIIDARYAVFNIVHGNQYNYHITVINTSSPDDDGAASTDEMQTDLDATLPTFDQIDGDQITYDIVVLISMRSIAGGQTLYHIRLAINIRHTPQH